MRQTTVRHLGREIDIQVHDGEFLSNLLRATHSFFELEILDFLRCNFPVQRTIIDAGANIGNHALFFQNFMPPSRLVCFEPLPANLTLLHANLGEGAEIFSCALGSKRGRRGLRFDPENLGICITDEQCGDEVEVVPLDEYGFEEVTLLKIDVEGDDLELLGGARATLERCRPVVVAEGNFIDLASALQGYGYLCVASWKGYNTFCFAPLSHTEGLCTLTRHVTGLPTHADTEVPPSGRYRLVKHLTALRAFHGIHGWRYDAPTYLAEMPGAGTITPIRTIRGKTLEREIPVATLTNIVILGTVGILVTSRGALLAESVHYPTLDLHLPPGNGALIDIGVQDRRPGAYVPLLGLWAGDLWHWIIEYLPRVLLAEEVGFKGVYLIQRGSAPFVRESLLMLGIAPGRIVEKGEEPWWVNELVIPTPITGTRGHQRSALAEYPALVKALRDLFREVPIPNPIAPQSERVLVSRRYSATIPRITNEPAVTGIAASHGFATIYPDHLTLQELLGTMRSTKTLITARANGLVHMLLAPNATTVVELADFSPARPDLIPFVEILEQTHHQTSPSPAADSEGGPFGVNLHELEVVLNQIVPKIY
jgi:FkbM family methyltransferase